MWTLTAFIIQMCLEQEHKLHAGKEGPGDAGTLTATLTVLCDIS